MNNKYQLVCEAGWWYVYCQGEYSKAITGSGTTVQEALNNAQPHLPPGAKLVIPLTLIE